MQLIWLMWTRGQVCGTTDQCTGMNVGDDFLGIYMGCGCLFLVAGRREWYWRVRLSGLPSCSEASRAAAAFQVVSCPSLCKERCHGGAELVSLCMRQSTAASGRISCISWSLSSHMETWRIVSSWLRIWQLHVLCLGVACGY